MGEAVGARHSHEQNPAARDHDLTEDQSERMGRGWWRELGWKVRISLHDARPPKLKALQRSLMDACVRACVRAYVRTYVHACRTGPVVSA